MQIVIVDDQCRDGSIDSMIQEVMDILSAYNNKEENEDFTVTIQIHDYRQQGRLHLQQKQQQDEEESTIPTLLIANNTATSSTTTSIIQKNDNENATNIDNYSTTTTINEVQITVDIISSTTSSSSSSSSSQQQRRRPCIAKALNCGLQKCKSKYIARMDADDVSNSNRFITQLGYFLGMMNTTTNTNIQEDEGSSSGVDVLATCSIIFTEKDNDCSSSSSSSSSSDDDDGIENYIHDANIASSSSNHCYDNYLLKSKIILPYSSNQQEEVEYNQKHTTTTTTNIRNNSTTTKLNNNNNKWNQVIRCSIPSVDSGFLAWSFLFTCVISHSSIMYRKESILNIGGYNEECRFAEDYDLWLRLLTQPSLSSSKTTTTTTKKKHSHHHPWNVRCIGSIPHIGLFHRKNAMGGRSHASSGTTTTADYEKKKSQQRKESVQVSKTGHTKTIEQC